MFNLKQDDVTRLEKEIKKDPSKVQSHYDLYRALYKVGRIDEAYKYLERAIQLDPNQKSLWKEKGDYICQHEGRPFFDLQVAEESYKRALEMDPKYGAALGGLNVLLKRQGKKEYIPPSPNIHETNTADDSDESDKVPPGNETDIEKRRQDAKNFAQHVRKWLRESGKWDQFLAYCEETRTSTQIIGLLQDASTDYPDARRKIFNLKTSLQVECPKKILDAKKAGTAQVLLVGKRLQMDLHDDVDFDEVKSRWVIECWKELLSG